MLTKELLEKYKTNYFIETGTHSGRAVMMALELSIPHILSVEVWEKLYREFKEQLGENEAVQLYHGDSPDMLPEMLEDVKEPAVIFLDAHAAVDGKDREQYGKSPVLFELEAIAKHPVKNHIIMVDDIDDFDAGQYDDVKGPITSTMIKDKIKEINPDYTFEQYGEEGHTILVATV